MPLPSKTLQKVFSCPAEWCDVFAFIIYHTWESMLSDEDPENPSRFHNSRGCCDKMIFPETRSFPQIDNLCSRIGRWEIHLTNLLHLGSAQVDISDCLLMQKFKEVIFTVQSESKTPLWDLFPTPRITLFGSSVTFLHLPQWVGR